MKRILALGSAAALTVIGGLAAIDWTQTENLATGAEVVVSSKFADAKTITDGNNGSSWQAYPQTHEYTQDWVLIDLGEEKTFNTVDVDWEASNATKYSIYVSKEPITYTYVEVKKGEGENETVDGERSHNLLDAEWLAAQTPAFVGELENNVPSHTIQTLASDGDVTGRYVLLYCDEYSSNAKSHGARIFEISLGKTKGSDEASALRVDAQDVLEGESIDVTVSPVNIAGGVVESELSDVTLTAAPQTGVVITKNENGSFSVKGEKIGAYTLTASAKAGEETLTGSVSINVKKNWNKVENIAEGKSVVAGRLTADVAEDYANGIANVTDGDVETYYEFDGEWGGGDGFVIIDLGAVYDVDAVGVYFKKCANTGGNFQVVYGAEGAVMPEDNTVIWTGDGEGWTKSNVVDRALNDIATVVPAQAQRVRYIAVRDTDNPGGKPQLAEIYVDGKVYEKPYAKAISVTSVRSNDDSHNGTALYVGEEFKLSAAVVDQYGDAFAGDIVFTVDNAEVATLNGDLLTAVKPGTVKVTATCGDLTKELTYVVIDTDNYCSFGANVTCDTGVDMSRVVAGTADIDNNKNAVAIQDGGDMAQSHWVLVDLGKPYQLDAVAATWEGACPESYTVYIGMTADDMHQIGRVEGHGMKSWRDRFAVLEEAQFVKIVTDRNATGWGCKMFAFKAYGKSNVVSVATSVSLEVSDDVVANDESVTLTGKVLDQFGVEMADQTIEYYANGIKLEGNAFKGEKMGEYELMAKCGELESDPVTVNVVAESKLAGPANTATMNGEAYDKNPFASETHWGGDLNQPIVITLDEVHHFEMIKLRWEAASCDYTVDVEYEDGTTARVFEVTDRKFKEGYNPIDRIVHDGSAAPGQKTRATSLPVNLNNVKKITITPTAKDHGYTVRLLGVDTYGVSKSVFDAVEGIAIDENEIVDVYTVGGVLVRNKVAYGEALEGLAKGIYIVGGKKVYKLQ